MTDRISTTIHSLNELPVDQQNRILNSTPLIDQEAFIESAFDTPAIARDKKRRRQIARKQMVEQGILPPNALLNTW